MMADNKHEKAIELTEEALDKLVQGDESGAQDLVRQAENIDRTGPEEVLRDLEEDASARGTKDKPEAEH